MEHYINERVNIPYVIMQLKPTPLEQHLNIICANFHPDKVKQSKFAGFCRDMVRPTLQMAQQFHVRFLTAKHF